MRLAVCAARKLSMETLGRHKQAALFCHTQLNSNVTSRHNARGTSTLPRLEEFCPAPLTDRKFVSEIVFKAWSL